MKVACPRTLVQPARRERAVLDSTPAVAPAIRRPTGLPLGRVPVRPEDIALAPEANRQA